MLKLVLVHYPNPVDNDMLLIDNCSDNRPLILGLTSSVVNASIHPSKLEEKIKVSARANRLISSLSVYCVYKVLVNSLGS